MGAGIMKKPLLCVLNILILTTIVQVVCPKFIAVSSARDLTDVLGEGLDITFLFRGSALGNSVAPAFTGAMAQAITQEFPLASVAPAFTYRYNPALSVFERSSSVPGPLFSERALTLGKGQLNFGVGYSFLDFSQVNGTDLHNIRNPGLTAALSFQDAVPLRQLPDTEESVFAAPFTGIITTFKLDLQAHVVVPTFRYGLTDRWDVGLSIPLINTFLRFRTVTTPVVDAPNLRFTYVVNAQGVAIRPATREIAGNFVDLAGNPITSLAQLQLIKAQNSSPRTVSRKAGSATGVGDIVLRTKYHLWRTDGGGAALGLNLHLPSGEDRNFQGANTAYVSPFLYLSQIIAERFEPHLNLGVNFKTDDVKRSSFQYAVGASVLVWQQLGFAIDLIGRSEFNKVQVRTPPEAVTPSGFLNRPVNTCTPAQPCTLDSRGIVLFPAFPIKIQRNDIINFTFGLRYALGTTGSVFFGGVVPLNNDGFRADFIPSGGVEYSF